MSLHTAGDGLDPFLFHLCPVGWSVVEASPGVEPAFEGVGDVVTCAGDADVPLSAVIGFYRYRHIGDVVDHLRHPVAYHPYGIVVDVDADDVALVVHSDVDVRPVVAVHHGGHGFEGVIQTIQSADEFGGGVLGVGQHECYHARSGKKPC